MVAGNWNLLPDFEWTVDGNNLIRLKVGRRRAGEMEKRRRRKQRWWTTWRKTMKALNENAKPPLMKHSTFAQASFLAAETRRGSEAAASIPSSRQRYQSQRRHERPGAAELGGLTEVVVLVEE